MQLGLIAGIALFVCLPTSSGSNSTGNGTVLSVEPTTTLSVAKKAGALGAVISSLFGTPIAAAQFPRIEAVRRDISCSQVAPGDSLILAEFGVEQNGVLVAAFVGPAIVLGLSSLQVVVAICYALVADVSLRGGFAAVRFPSLAAVPVFFLLQQTSTFAVRLLLEGVTPMPQFVAAVFVLVLCTSLPFAVPGYLNLTFGASFNRWRNTRSSIQLKLLGAGLWEDERASNRHYVSRNGGLFDAFREQAFLFSGVELALCLMSGVALGLHETFCEWTVVALGVLLALYFVLLVWLRPFNSFFTQWLTVSVTLLQVLVCIAQFLDSSQQVTDSLSFAMLALVTVRAPIDFALWVVAKCVRARRHVEGETFFEVAVPLLAQPMTLDRNQNKTPPPLSPSSPAPLSRASSSPSHAAEFVELLGTPAVPGIVVTCPSPLSMEERNAASVPPDPSFLTAADFNDGVWGELFDDSEVFGTDLRQFEVLDDTGLLALVAESSEGTSKEVLEVALRALISEQAENRVRVAQQLAGSEAGDEVSSPLRLQAKLVKRQLARDRELLSLVEQLQPPNLPAAVVLQARLLQRVQSCSDGLSEEPAHPSPSILLSHAAANSPPSNAPATVQMDVAAAETEERLRIL